MSKPTIENIRKVKRYADGAMYLWAARNNVRSHRRERWNAIKDEPTTDCFYIEARAVLLGVEAENRIRIRRRQIVRKQRNHS